MWRQVHAAVSVVAVLVSYFAMSNSTSHGA